MSCLIQDSIDHLVTDPPCASLTPFVGLFIIHGSSFNVVYADSIGGRSWLQSCLSTAPASLGHLIQQNSLSLYHVPFDSLMCFLFGNSVFGLAQGSLSWSAQHFGLRAPGLKQRYIYLVNLLLFLQLFSMTRFSYQGDFIGWEETHVKNSRRSQHISTRNSKRATHY